jgi:hypothetical protein
MSITPLQWQKMSPAERIEALQQNVGALTARDQPSRHVSVHSFQPESETLGTYDSGTIRINESLINQDTPYAAMETLYHEYRHSYQDYVANERPDLAESAQQLEDFQKNQIGYIHPNTVVSMYLAQPIEADARAYARQAMESTYGIQNDPAYEAHRQARDQDEIMGQRLAEITCGSDYAQQAREIAYDIYDTKQAESHNVVPTQEADTLQQSSQDEDETLQQARGRSR